MMALYRASWCRICNSTAVRIEYVTARLAMAKSQSQFTLNRVKFLSRERMTVLSKQIESEFIFSVVWIDRAQNNELNPGKIKEANIFFCRSQKKCTQGKRLNM
jgi:hypothetical protein